MNMIPARIAAALAVLVVVAPSLVAQQGKRIELPQPSPAATLKQRVGYTDIEIDYSRPGVKGRTVFGDLEPYGVVWRTGANSATKITFSTDVEFGGTHVKAGTYALFSIPGASEWTVILNNVPGQWGSYSYDAKNDVARATTTAVKLGESVETFTIDLNDIRDDSATLNLIWQNTRVPVKLGFDTVAVAQKRIEEAMSGTEKVGPGAYDQAALFYLEHNLDLDKAAQWIGSAIAAQPDAFYLYYHQARILAKKGDKAGAIAAAKKSIEMAGSGNNATAKDEYTRLNQKIISSLGGE
jgi:hypothetical protein